MKASNEESPMNEDNDDVSSLGNRQEGERLRDFIPETMLIPNDMRHSAGECCEALQSMDRMLKRNAYTDITFMVQGTSIIAHRVVVSGWSRWLNGIVANVDAHDVITLDVFQPTAFSAVIDYMYGRPLTFPLSDADDIMKVIRRLEMIGLEEHCWEYCLKIVSKDNCEQLHALADKYSCPPLKLAAWRTLQENSEAYQSAPGRSLLVASTGVEGVGHGLTGPEEFYAMEMREEQAVLDRLLEAQGGDQSKKGRRVSMATGQELNYDDIRTDLEGQSDDEDGDERRHDMDNLSFGEEGGNSSLNKSLPKTKTDPISVLSRYRNNENRDPRNLDVEAGAHNVVLAWSSRLQKVYDRCAPAGARAGDVYGDTYDDIDWSSELRHIYLVLNLPHKVEQIPQILSTWAGKEDKMLRSFLFKYRSSLPTETAAHLENMVERLEVVRAVFNKDDLQGMT